MSEWKAGKQHFFEGGQTIYDELIKRLREANEKSMCGECGLNLHTGATKKGVLFAEAADVIEELSMKLRGDEAAIAGMKREIERAVVNATDVAALAQNRFDRLLAENDDLRKRLAETGKTLSWISVEERLPEESEGLNWHEDRTIRFTSVWCCDVNTGTIGVRNRLQCKKPGLSI